jgi:hypothetical protein
MAGAPPRFPAASDRRGREEALATEQAATPQGAALLASDLVAEAPTGLLRSDGDAPRER